MKKIIYFLSSIGLTQTGCDSRQEYIEKIHAGHLDSTKETVKVAGAHPYQYWYWRRFYVPSYTTREIIHENSFSESEHSSTSERGGFGEHGMSGHGGAVE